MTNPEAVTPTRERFASVYNELLKADRRGGCGYETHAAMKAALALLSDFATETEELRAPAATVFSEVQVEALERTIQEGEAMLPIISASNIARENPGRFAQLVADLIVLRDMAGRSK